LDKVGAFDAALFMYQDEVDLCWRIRLAGYKISYAAEAICYHFGSPTDILEYNLRMPVWKFYYIHGKNRIRVLIKNYSYSNLIKRLPGTLTLIYTRGLMLTVINKNPKYLLAVLKGSIWNVLNIRDTINQRRIVQHFRKINDNQIQQFMLTYSLELAAFKELLRSACHTGNRRLKLESRS
jgi:GT2 family glycosyltransferase